MCVYIGVCVRAYRASMGVLLGGSLEGRLWEVALVGGRCGVCTYTRWCL